MCIARGSVCACACERQGQKESEREFTRPLSQYSRGFTTARQTDREGLKDSKERDKALDLGRSETGWDCRSESDREE